MNLDDSVLYASAALFVLACYSLSIESGCEHRVGSKTGAWGIPLEVIADAITSRRDITSSGWGWPLVGPGGVCDRVFRTLNVKPAAGASLLSLPEGVHPLETEPQRDDFLNLVQVFARHVDPDIDVFQGASERAAINVCKGSSDGSIPDRAVSPDVHDKRETSQDGAEELTSELSALDELTLPPEQLEKREEEALRQALMALQDDPEAMQRINTETRIVEDAALTEGAALPEPCFEGCDVYTYKAPAVSFEALRALITGCLLTEFPTPKSSPTLRWYDARARVTALRVAHWLRVPRASFHALELELMGDASPAEAMAVSQASLHSYHSTRMKWLKVGAAAVGGGVLTAVTAGLAAPAIVAGVGTLVGLTGSAGAAATITGAATSAASLGIVSGGSGAAGAAFYSSKMAKRSADVTEFGFVRLSQWDAFQTEMQGTPSRNNSITHQLEHNNSIVEDFSPHCSASELPATADTRMDSAGSPTRIAQQGSLGPSGLSSSAVASPAQIRREASTGALHSTSQAASGRVVGGGEASTSAGAFVVQSPGSSQRRSWKQWGKQKLWRSSSTSSLDALANPDPLSVPEAIPAMVAGSAEALIAVNGWLGQREDFLHPFQSLSRRQGNTMTLVWESRELMAVRTAFRRLLARSASIQTVQLALYATVSGLATATIWPVAVLNCATLIDSAWDVACLRAESGGKLLANMMAARLHGDRPVVLLGVSIGARLVYYCLLELYKLGAQGIVEHAIILGAPVAIDPVKLQTARSVVAGRFINGFCVTDWLLALCSRTKIGHGAFKPVAGLRPVSVAGIEDMDFTSIVSSHSDWSKNMSRVLFALHLTGST